jgi:mannose-6-phosphate isomerase-like protein (cupin superfamily)
VSDVFQVLNLITIEALCQLRQRTLRLLPDTTNQYLGRWERVEIDKSHFASIADAELLRGMSIEIIKAFDDMSEHLHLHEHCDAVITVLGASEGYDDPIGCKVYFKSHESFPAVAGMTLQVPRRTMHSFSGGKTPIAFLSVQSSKIDEDYRLVE